MKKKILAVVVMVTMFSLLTTTTAFAAVEDGLTYDELLGNVISNGTFENGVEGWLPDTGISKEMDNTRLNSAGAALVNQADETVYCSFEMESHKYYSAEAYVKLYNDEEDEAKIVFENENGDLIASTAVKTTVNGTDWTKLEGEFISLADEEVICYIELDNETEFYLDDVIIKQTYILPESVVSVDLVEDNDGKTYLMGVIAADAEGAVSYELSHTFLSQTFYDISARLMLDSESVTETAEAYTAYKKLTGWGNGTPAGLESGVMTEVTYNAKPNTATGTITKKVAVYIEGAAEGDVIYFGGFGLKPTLYASPSEEAVVNLVEFNALVGSNSLVNVSADANTVALRYFYSVQDQDGNWNKIKTGHTNSGDINVPSVYLDSSFTGKKIRLEVEPMNAECFYGNRVATVVWLDAPTYGDLKYAVYGGEVTIICCNKAAFGKLIIPDNIDGCPVTSLGAEVFYNCSSLTDISIPDSVTSIGGSAFYGCSSLTSITIPDSVTSVGDSAFYDCSNLTSITIPDSVTSIGDSAFYGCSSLTSITIPFVGGTKYSNTYFGYIFGAGSYSYNNNYVPTSLKEATITSGENISSYAFYNCGSLTSITIPDSVTSIGDSAFYGCSSMTSITIPDSVTSIGDSAFYGCSSMTSITIPDSVTSIGGSAFYGCSSLTSITIPNSVTSVGSSAFYNCSSLTNITIPFVGGTKYSNTYFGYIFGAGSYSYNNNYVPTSLKEATITSGENISSYAFYNCSSLTSITIPDSVTSIGDSAFYGCSGLIEMTIPFVGSSRTENASAMAVFGYIFGDGLMSVTQKYSSDGQILYSIPSTLRKVAITDADIIPYGAFSGCSQLTDIVINDGVERIHHYAFEGCNSLYNLTVYSDDMFWANSNLFTECMVVLYGNEGSTTEAYAEKYGLNFKLIGTQTATTSTATVTQGKIVLFIDADTAVVDECLHAAIYSADNELVDYMIIPPINSYQNIAVVFRDNADAAYAKVFVWDSAESMNPLATAEKVNITR